MLQKRALLNKYIEEQNEITFIRLVFSFKCNDLYM